MNSVLAKGEVGNRQGNQCVICFNQFKINNTPPSVSQKMYRLCRKYLHSDIMKESVAASWDLSAENKLLLFCQHCFENAVELNDLTEQLEFLQKSISELIVMFSMGVLHRRGKSSKLEENAAPDSKPGKGRKKLVEVDVSGLTDCDSWSFSMSTPMLSSSPPKKSLSVKDEQVENENENKTQHIYVDPLIFEEDYEDMDVKDEAEVVDVDDDIQEIETHIKAPTCFVPTDFLQVLDPTPTVTLLQVGDVGGSILHSILEPGMSASVEPVEQENPPEGSRQRRKSKLIPLHEQAEESSTSSNAESSVAEAKSRRLYHLDPKSVQPGRDRRRVQKALNCYKYRLKKKHEAEQKIGKLNSEVATLKMQLQKINQTNGNTSHRVTRRNLL